MTRPFDSSRWSMPLTFAFALVGLAVLGYALLLWSGGSRGWGYDFAAYYNAIARLSQTGSPYTLSTVTTAFGAGPYGLYLYSPVPVVVLSPLGSLPADAATWAFVGVRLVLLVATCALMPISRSLRLATLGIAAITAPVLYDFDLGNVSLVVTFLAVVAWRWMDRPAAAAAIAAALSLRMTMGLFAVWWLIRGRWRVVLWLAASGAVLFVLTLPFVGVRGWLDYIAVLRNLSGFEGVYRNFAVGALVERLTGSSSIGTLSLFAGYLAAMVAMLFSLRRDREVSFMVTLGATLVLSPLLWDHYLTNAVVAGAFVASRGKPWGLVVPLLCWLPQETLPFVALLAMVVPFAVQDRGEPALQSSVGSRPIRLGIETSEG